jgi:hypothetical protein
VTALVAVWAAPAVAHVEVSADKTLAGATDVTLTFTAESESTSAGVVSMQVVLPAGIAPADVTYVSGPKGWKFTRNADGYTVGGPALAVGKEFSYKVKIAKLPTDADTISFKTLEKYSDGEVDRWIEIPTPGGDEPDNPAPTLELTGATSSAPPTTSPPAPAPTTATTPTTASGGSGTSAWLWILLAVVLAAIVGALLWARRRRESTG